MAKRDTQSLISGIDATTDEPLRQGGGLEGFKQKATPEPVHVPEPVSLAPAEDSAPRTYRMPRAFIAEWEAFCKAHGFAKGSKLAELGQQFMDAYRQQEGQ